MTKVSDLHRKWMKTKEYRKAYQELAPEFELARAVIAAAWPRPGSITLEDREIGDRNL